MQILQIATKNKNTDNNNNNNSDLNTGFFQAHQCLTTELYNYLTQRLSLFYQLNQNKCTTNGYYKKVSQNQWHTIQVPLMNE